MTAQQLGAFWCQGFLNTYAYARGKLNIVLHRSDIRWNWHLVERQRENRESEGRRPLQGFKFVRVGCSPPRPLHNFKFVRVGRSTTLQFLLYYTSNSTLLDFLLYYTSNSWGLDAILHDNYTASNSGGLVAPPHGIRFVRVGRSACHWYPVSSRWLSTGVASVLRLTFLCVLKSLRYCLLTELSVKCQSLFR